MKVMLLIGLAVYWLAVIRISYPKIQDVVQLRRDKKANLDHFHDDDLLLNQHYGSLAFILFVSLMFTLIIISMIVMGDFQV